MNCEISCNSQSTFLSVLVFITNGSKGTFLSELLSVQENSPCCCNDGLNIRLSLLADLCNYNVE